MMEKMEQSKTSCQLPLMLSNERKVSPFGGLSKDELQSAQSRQQWGHSVEFVLSLIGYAVGVSNLWRFPYLCLRNGGGAFLIPYFFFLIFAGIPLFYMEVCLGQFSGISSLFVWRLCPLFRGLGYCMIIVSGMACIYYNGVLSWIIYYLYSSFTGDLPWATCGNWWNTPTCTSHSSSTNSTLLCNSSTDHWPDAYNQSTLSSVNSTTVPCLLSSTLANSLNNSFDGKVVAKSAAEEFWQYNVLRKTSGLHDLGSLQLHSSLTLLIAWILVALCLIRGVKSLGKVVYVTALLPYLLLTIFLVRGCLLPGALDGILFYVTPKFSCLTSFTVWIEACLQVFYSLGPAWGGLVTMASFNKFHNNCFRDAVIASLADGLTSFYGGFVIFSVLGFMAKEANTTVDLIATQGPGLALVAYPEAISKLPLPPLWAIMFFIMLLSLGLDSQFGMFETVISGLVDAFPHQLRKYRSVLTVTLCIASYLVSLPIATNGGIYVFQLLDWYVAAFCVTLASFIECMVIAWIYGVERFSEDIELMLGKPPSIVMKICWSFITPLLMLTAFLSTVVKYELPVYDGYVYPPMANAIGFVISFFPIIPIPYFMIKELLISKGSFKQRLCHSLHPSSSWGPSVPEYRAVYVHHLQEFRPFAFLCRRNGAVRHLKSTSSTHL